MLTPKKIAVTGGLSSGKSSVCRILAHLGAYVIDADAISHRLLCPNTALGEDIQKLLGADVLVNGCFDRAKIAERVFRQPSRLSALEGLLHPAIRAEIMREYEKVSREGCYRFFVVEVPLLYESHWEDDFDVVVAVIADEALARRRYGMKGKSDFDARMNRQWSPQKKAQRADYIIKNNASQRRLLRDTKALFSRL